MTKSAFVCRRCHRVVHNPYEQFVLRHDYVRADMQERTLSRAVADYCRDCVELIRAELDHRDGLEQGRLEL